jgi:hypothetical protein
MTERRAVSVPTGAALRPRRYAFIFVCQQGPLEVQAVLLAASLRLHLRCEHELIACVPGPRDVWGAPSAATLDLLHEMGARIAPITNPFGPGHAHANKIACLTTPTSADKIVFLDTDMLLLKEFHDEPRFEAALNLKPADFQMFDASDELWRCAYAAAETPMPSARLSTTVSNELGLPYFNSGFVAINSGVPLADAWIDCARRLNGEEKLPKPDPWSDQTSLAIAIQKLRLEYDLLDERYNYPAHVRPLPNDSSPWFCHYHRPHVVGREPRLAQLVQASAARHPAMAPMLREANGWGGIIDSRGERPIPSAPERNDAAGARSARLVAFYLPQFHPIPENDEWWGKGFTEWTNVCKAEPMFPGHYQPHLPANLGFYDLRVPEARQAQADLAANYGIEAFCYWHFWFNGRRLLERPFNEVLASGQPDFPFCLAWANESWSRRWLGEEKQVLLKQTYSAADDAQHARWLVQAFRDRRYFRVDGRPLFLVYRPKDVPDPRATTTAIRDECARAGLPNPLLVGIESHVLIDFRPLGFDANLEFEPFFGALRGPLQAGTKTYDYAAARKQMKQARPGHDAYPCLMVSWDNTPRRGEHGIVMTSATPESFEEGLHAIVAAVQAKPPEHRLVFLNAWNEWAEGNHLEPDLKHGLRYLEAVRRVNGAVWTESSSPRNHS